MNTLLFTSILTIIIFILSRFYIDFETELLNNNSIDYKTFKEIAQTGDLILYRWNYVESTFRFFSKYSHCSMIVKLNNKLYILEIHPTEFQDNKNLANGGVHLYPLKKRLLEYSGSCYFSNLKKKCNRKKIKNKILKKINNYKKIQFDRNFKHTFLLGSICNKIGIKYPFNKQDLFCSEFICKLMVDLELYDFKSDNFSFTSPETFTGIGIYNESKKIIF